MAVPVATTPAAMIANGAALPGGVSQEFDALILPPVKGQWAHTLRQQVARRRAILIAESAPQVGGIYLGPRNFEGAQALGRFAGRHEAGGGCERRGAAGGAGGAAQHAGTRRGV